MPATNRLAEIVASRRRELGYSLRDVVRRAAEHGYSITSTSINDYERGKSVPMTDKIEALSAGLSIPSNIVAEAARLAADEMERKPALPEYALLDEQNREIIRSHTLALLADQRRLEELERETKETADTINYLEILVAQAQADGGLDSDELSDVTKSLLSLLKDKRPSTKELEHAERRLRKMRNRGRHSSQKADRDLA